ncbi:formate dehydrogenase accessory sulfurtransferase FdhD [Chloroflexota bacterium]
MRITSSELVEMETGELVNYSQYTKGEWQPISGKLPDETLLSLFVNGQELVSILCTPEKLNCLVVGFLRSEGFISSLDEIAMMRICLDESLADVRLTHQVNITPTKRILTSGCGGGTTFEQGMNLKPLDSNWCVSPSQILSSIRFLQRKPESQNENGGIRRGMHVSALSDGDNLIVRAEDIGRHNTLDKIWGECLLTKTSTENRLLVTTGRISSEMLIKTAKMGISVVASLNSATGRAVSLACDLGLTVVGYAHGNRLSVFTGKERLQVNSN